MRYWARVGGIFQDPNVLTKELLSDEFRKDDAAGPVGEGKYGIVKHQNHAELAYILEMPEQPGKAQKELGIEKEASYIISVISPKVPRPSTSSGLPSTEEPPKYPEEVLKEFSETENFVSLSRDTRLIDYQNAQIILIGAREGRDVIKKEITPKDIAQSICYALLNQGESLYKLGKHDEASKLYDKALEESIKASEKNPRDSHAWTFHGISLLLWGDLIVFHQNI